MLQIVVWPAPPLSQISALLTTFQSKARSRDTTALQAGHTYPYPDSHFFSYTSSGNLCPNSSYDQITFQRKFSPNLKSFLLVFLMTLSLLAMTLIIICSQVVLSCLGLMSTMIV